MHFFVSAVQVWFLWGLPFVAGLLAILLRRVCALEMLLKKEADGGSAETLAKHPEWLASFKSAVLLWCSAGFVPCACPKWPGASHRDAPLVVGSRSNGCCTISCRRGGSGSGGATVFRSMTHLLSPCGSL